VQFTRFLGSIGLAACALAVCAIAALAMGLGGQPDSRVVGTGGAYSLPSSVHTRTIVRSAAPSSPPVTQLTTAPTQSFVPPATPASAVPPAGEATAWGCGPALLYLNAYAAPGFTLECPASAQGHEASTSCISEHSPCDEQRVIAIAEPCPSAYMNEASNSWVLMGQSNAPIDPYGQCP
jgi:hypothetical protein